MKNTIIAVLLLVGILTTTSPTLAHDAKEMEELRRAISLTFTVGDACRKSDWHLSQMVSNATTQRIAVLHGDDEMKRKASREWKEEKAAYDKWSKTCAETSTEFIHILDEWKRQNP